MANNRYYLDIGTKIKNIRKERGISQKDFAHMLGIPISTLANYENNHREPSIDLLIRIYEILGVSLDTLKKGSNNLKDIGYSEVNIPNIGNKIKEIRKSNKLTQSGEGCSTVKDNGSFIVKQDIRNKLENIVSCYSNSSLDYKEIIEVVNFIEIAIKCKLEEIYSRNKE